MKHANAKTFATIATIVVLVVAFAPFLFLGYCCHSCMELGEPTPAEKARYEQYGDKIDAWVAAEDFVKDHLRSPGTADFGWQRADKCVTDLGEGQYCVKGWVDAQNAFGAIVRSDFTLTLKYTGDDKWQLVEGPVLQQR